MREFDAEFGSGAAARDAGQFFALLPWLLVLCAGLLALAAAVEG